MRQKRIDPGGPGGRTFLPRLALAASVLVVFLFQAGGQTQAADTAEKADRIEVHKAEHTMNLLRGGKVVKSYKVALSTVPVGAKEREGDHKVPEGLYIVDRKNAQSKFHLALHINYPNATDRERARKLGVRPGGDIAIHGLGAKFGWVGAAHRQVDWTDGCVAVTNSEMEEIWPLVDVGTVVEIRP
jgi:murein L,D-transpeptidase YafK